MHHSEQRRSRETFGDGREIRDLSDFCQKWAGLRELIEVEDLQQSGLSREQLDVVNWLRELADRVCKFERFSN
ncbi:MAG: hypothetical protein R3287_05810 [Anderseniella sp.]|nr:hypothetical protein [Anderseniella sp.]